MSTTTRVAHPAIRLRDALRAHRRPQAAMDLRPLWRGQALERYADAPVAVRRARALSSVLSQMPLCMRDEDLIVGTPAGVLSDGLPEGLDLATYNHYAALDEALGERSFLTNFDHAAVDYDKLLRVGLSGLLDEARASMQAQQDPERRAFLEAMQIALEAAARYAARWAEACLEAAQAAEFGRCKRLLRMAGDLHAIWMGVPRTFSQAVQLVWLVHVILAIEGRGAMAFGRMDQYLLPFYRRAVARGEADDARQILECLWAKLEEPMIGNPIQNIAIGGQTPSGADATNELSFLLLDVTRTVGTPCSNLSARMHAGTPDAFYDACIELIKTGIGFPAVFNDEVLVPALVSLEIPIEDARDVAFVGCIETFLPGKMPPWSDSRVNMLAAVDRAIRNGCDGLDGAQRGLPTGDPRDLATFDDLMAAFQQQMAHIVTEHCAMISDIKRSVEPEICCSPFLSAFVADCIQRGLDVNMGGARYPDLHGPAGMGLGTTADALAAIKWFIYDKRALSWDEMIAALDANFQGMEPLRQRLLREAPKYGNGDPYVDDIAAQVVRVFTTEVLSKRTPSGGRFVPLMAANVANIPAGKEVAATPDGRRALEPVSDAASPTFGRDRHGPTALIDSLTRVDYLPVVGGTVVNVKFGPGTLDGPEGAAALRSLIKTYFFRGGMQMQFNVTGHQVLEDAIRHPEQYRDLVVRVSGFSAIYVELAPAVQQDILARTEY